jgi:serine/threonine-protein kinase
VYSLGTLLYEMICGAAPWTREQERQIVAGLAHDLQPQPMSKFRRDVPPELERLVRQSLAWEPGQRPVAEDMAAALAALAPNLDNTPAQTTASEPRDADGTSLLPAARWPG